MSTVNYSLNHRGVRLIGASEARKTTKTGEWRHHIRISDITENQDILLDCR